MPAPNQPSDLFEAIRQAEEAMGIRPVSMKPTIAALRAGERVTVSLKEEVVARAAILLQDELLPRVDGWMRQHPGSLGMASFTRENCTLHPYTAAHIESIRQAGYTPDTIMKTVATGMRYVCNYETTMWTGERAADTSDSPNAVHFRRLAELLQQDEIWAAYVENISSHERAMGVTGLYFSGGFNTALKNFCGPMAVAPQVFQASAKRPPEREDLRGMFAGVRPFGKRMASAHLLMHHARQDAITSDKGASVFRPETLSWDNQSKEWGFAPEATRRFLMVLQQQRDAYADLLLTTDTTATGLKTSCVGMHTTAFEDMERWLTPAVENLYLPQFQAASGQ